MHFAAKRKEINLALYTPKRIHNVCPPDLMGDERTNLEKAMNPFSALQRFLIVLESFIVVLKAFRKLLWGLAINHSVTRGEM